MSYKLLHHISSIKKLEPISLTIDLTHKCNLNCHFCLVKNRPINEEEISLDKIEYVLDHLPSLKSVEIGAGEATLYHDFDGFVNLCNKKGLKIGMASNGYNLHKIDRSILSKISWIVIGCTTLIDTNNLMDFSWLPCRYSFNYVFNTKSPLDIKNRIEKFLSINKSYGYFQFRLDINNTSTSLSEVFDGININGVKKVNMPERGKKRSGICYYGRLKPYLVSDGNFYPCCVKVEDYDYSRAYPIAKWNEIDKLLNATTIVNCNCTKWESQKMIESFLNDKDSEFVV